MDKPIIDEILKMYLVKQLYLVELSRILIQTSNGRNYDEVDVLEKEVSNNTKRELDRFGVSPEHVTPNLNGLVSEEYLYLWSPDQKKTMYVRVLQKGMIAISTGEFWQKLEGRERDLLQKRITELQGNVAKSQINFNTRSLILAGVSVLFIAVTAYLQYQDKTALRVQELQQTMQDQSQQLRNIRTSVEALNSSIQTLKIDTPISVRVKTR